MEPMHWERAIAIIAEDKGISRGIALSPKAKTKARAKMEETGGRAIGTTKEESREERPNRKEKEVRKEEHLGMGRQRQERDPEQVAGGAEERTMSNNAPR